MTELYKPKIKPIKGIGYEGDDWSKQHFAPSLSPYEFSYIPITKDPFHHYWTWGVFAALYKVGQDILDELIADGWEPWTDETRPYFFYAHNQGSQILIIEEASFKTQEWVRKEDIRFAKRYPVALAHRTVLRESQEKVLTHLRIGSCALIDDGGQSRVYYLKQLPQQEEANELCDTINDGLGLALDGDRATRQARRRELWPQTHEAAQLLAEMYWEHHQRLRPPDVRPPQEVSVSALPMIPTIIRDNAMLTAVGSPMEALLQAYSDAQEGARHWLGREDKAIPTYIHQGEHGKTQLQLRPPKEGRPDEKALEQLWNEVDKLSDYDGDVLLILAAQQITSKPDERGYVWISSKAILDYRDIEPIWKTEKNGKRRRAGHRTEDQEKISGIMARMSNSWVQVEEWIVTELRPATKKQKSPVKEKRTLYTREDRLLDVGSVVRQKELPDGQDEATVRLRNGMAVAWRYRLGSWIDPFLSGANRQVAWLFQQALKYDPYRSGHEKRLARHLSWHFLRHAKPDGIEPLQIRVNDLLAIMKIVVDERYPGRARKHLEDALKRLEEDKLIVIWSYDIVSGDDAPGKRQKKWLPAWLMMVVRIEINPPASPLALREIPLSPRLEEGKDA